MSNKLQELEFEIAELRLEKVQLGIQRIMEAEKFRLQHPVVFETGDAVTGAIKGACTFAGTQIRSVAEVFLAFCLEIRKIEERKKPIVIISSKRRYKQMEQNEQQQVQANPKLKVQEPRGLGTPEMNFPEMDFDMDLGNFSLDF